ncbi:MAG: sigma-70 family RNA polymerase sigma factor [Cyclobacteriaceae bacterium]
MKPECSKVAPVFLDYKEHLHRYILSRVRDQGLAEEILSQVMLKIYNSCDKLEGVNNTQAWMVTIARNAIMDHFRIESKSSGLETQESMLSADTTTTLEKSLAECVEPMIMRLPEIYREPLLAHELKGISQKSLAVQYGMSESGMKSRIQRGRKLLKEEFLACCHIEVGANGIEEVLPKKWAC